MSRSRKLLVLDGRKRITLGPLARHDMYVAAVDAAGVITLTPQQVTDAGPAVPVRRPRKRATAASRAQKISAPPAGEATP